MYGFLKKRHGKQLEKWIDYLCVANSLGVFKEEKKWSNKAAKELIVAEVF